jgi:serine protease AprX
MCGFPFGEVVGATTVQHPQHALGARHASVSGGAIVCAPLASGVTSRSGTSFAVAHVSGVCAVLMEAWTKRTGLTASPALLKAWLINGADDLGQVACPAPAHTPGSANCLHAPSNAAGWGRVSLLNMLKDVRGARLFFDEPTTFVNPGEVFTRRIAPVDTAMPMRVTLVWTDPPGDPVDEGALRHDLNLEVESDNGSRFLGNVNFASGFSAPVVAGAPPDHINNVECVYVQNPTGSYTVRVFAPPSFDVKSASQTFALVIENAQIAPTVPHPPAPRAPTNVRIVRT